MVAMTMPGTVMWTTGATSPLAIMSPAAEQEARDQRQIESETMAEATMTTEMMQSVVEVKEETKAPQSLHPPPAGEIQEIQIEEDEEIPGTTRTAARMLEESRLERTRTPPGVTEGVMVEQSGHQRERTRENRNKRKRTRRKTRAESTRRLWPSP